jgi:hypothetical protein
MPIDKQTGIFYTERFRAPDNSPKEIYENGTQQRFTRTVDIPWVKRAQWAQRKVGYSTAVTGGGQRWILRSLPDSYPENLAMKCVRCEVEGHGVDQVNGTANDSGTMPRYTLARVAMTYQQVSYKCISDNAMPQLSPGVTSPDESSLKRFVTRTYHPAGEFLTTNPGLLYWVDNPVANPPQPLPFGAPRIVPFVEVGYTWHQVPMIPLFNIEACLGTVNNAPFDVNNPNIAFGYDTETLLFVACEIEPIFNVNGYVFQDIANAGADPDLSTNLLYNIHYRFKYLPNIDLIDNATRRGHNWFLRNLNKVLNYFRVSQDGTAASSGPYPKSDFRQLFRLF